MFAKLFVAMVALSIPAFPQTSEKKVSAQITEPEKVKQSFSHFDLGLGTLPYPVPTLIVGHRNQWHHHGLDLSLRFSTFLIVSDIAGTASYLYYFRPDQKSQMYFGTGVGLNEVITIFGHGHFFVSPELTFGKEYLNKNGNKRIIQAQIGLVSFEKQLVPWIVVSYGFGF